MTGDATEGRTGRSTFRTLSVLEGISLLVLVLIAMPLKYVMGIPLAVRIVGLLHGVLFLALLAVAFQVLLERSLSKGRVLGVLGLSLVPFGFLFADRFLRQRSPRDDAAPRPPA